MVENVGPPVDVYLRSLTEKEMIEMLPHIEALNRRLAGEIANDN
jgi:hypothetical protein